MSAAIQTLSDAPAPASSGAGDSALSVEQADALLRDMGQKARSAASMLTLAPAEQKTKALKAMAHDLRSHANDILSANIKDMEAGKARGLSGAMLDRLLLTPDRIEGIARGLEAVADQPDPIGAVLASWTQPNGLQFERVRVPLGVVGIIYESRPNVTMDAGALCLKSGNAAILRGGSESFHSSHALARSLAAGLEKAGLPADAIQLMPTTDRAAVGAMLRADHAIDIIIPRGGKGLIERVQTESRVPVIAHLDGICHTYLHASADPQMAADIVENAKMRR
ncbi:MAG: glutamate-5-semialdehyde dehydrogenase, partial [Pseudomonadota bacterium]